MEDTTIIYKYQIEQLVYYLSLAILSETEYNSQIIEDYTPIPLVKTNDITLIDNIFESIYSQQFYIYNDIQETEFLRNILFLKPFFENGFNIHDIISVFKELTLNKPVEFYVFKLLLLLINFGLVEIENSLIDSCILMKTFELFEGIFSSK